MHSREKTVTKLVESIRDATPEILGREIRKWDSQSFMELQPFVRQHYWHGNASINVFRVVGTKHPDYAGMSWLELLEKGKRMPINLRLHKENPGYYADVQNKQPTMYYLSLDGGELYVGADGNHRTCIAKADFFLTGRNVLHGVTVDDYRIDWKLKSLHDEIRKLVVDEKLPFTVEVRTEAVSRDDSHGWMLERYKPRIKVIETNSREEYLLDSSEAGQFIERLKKRGGLIARLLGKGGMC